MKSIEVFYKGSGKFVEAYEKEDRDWLIPLALEAKEIWYQEWLNQGSPRKGTCCGGKGLEVWYRGPRKRSAKPVNLVACDFVQGNQAAYDSHKPALDYLKKNGVVAEYNDGWMS